MNLCPCGSSKDYTHCCGLFISRLEKPSTPEQLMRSRYTAYTRTDLDYIEQTMKGPAAKNFNKEEALDWAKQVTWLGLEVVQSNMNNNQGSVEFIAHYEDRGQRLRIHEISAFRCEDGQWYYVDGTLFASKPGRNEPCPCGSLKKYKKCCG